MRFILNKQNLGKDPDGKYIDGQFINIPYYNKTERTAFNFDGKPFTFDQFVKVIEANSYTADELEEFGITHMKEILSGGSEEFSDGPPCLGILTKEKLSDGRDRFLYNYAVYSPKRNILTIGKIWLRQRHVNIFKQMHKVF